jgi:small-conductance mechanosensitive channel
VTAPHASLYARAGAAGSPGAAAGHRTIAAHLAAGWRATPGPGLPGTQPPIGVLGTPPGPNLASACHQPPGIACRIVWDLTHSQATASFTEEFLARPILMVLRIAFVLALALIARWLVHRMITKLTERAGADLGKLDAINRLVGERRYQRAQALGSLLRNASSVVIFGIAGVTIAGYVGLNLAPILASAGVLGLAIGFGAQSLVRDFLSGIFMLLEDQYGVGDVINAGEATGTVEAVGLRTTRLRDVNGVVWHIRNGTISRIGNQSQGWSRAVVDFPVAYRHDLGRARAIMKETAVRLWEEPPWHELIIEEPEVWGVESVYSDAVVMRLVAKTLPMHQTEVARELRERVKTALDQPADGAAPVIAASGAAAVAPAPETVTPPPETVTPAPETVTPAPETVAKPAVPSPAEAPSAPSLPPAPSAARDASPRPGT